MTLNTKTLLLLTICLIISLFSLTGHAADDVTVNFSVRVYKESCDVSVNGGSNEGNVMMAPALASDFPTKGSMAAHTRFDIRLTGCDEDLPSIRLLFFDGQFDSSIPDISRVSCTERRPSTEFETKACHSLLLSTNPTINVAFFDVSEGSDKCTNYERNGWIMYDNDGTSCRQKIGDTVVFTWEAKAVRVSDGPVQPGPYQAKVIYRVKYD